MNRLPVSVLLLARDETRDLEELLPALDFASEVVVVWDPRGEPATRAVAERLGARVHERVFDGFGAQRQFALECCTQDWVLWIDADERLDAAARALFAGGSLLRPGDEPPWAMTLGRVSWFLGRRIRHCGWQDERVLRVFRRRCSRFDGALVHEQAVFLPPGERGAAGAAGEPERPRVEALAAGLEHHSYRTREDCETKLRRYGEANAEKAFRAGKRAHAVDVALRPALRFLRQYVLQLGFLDGREGLLLCWYAARQVRLKYALLRTRSRGGASA
jgi:(heptosyl)LPS beta-1,4-glucosyltransferase